MNDYFQAVLFDVLPSCLCGHFSFVVNDKLRKKANYKKELQTKLDAKRAKESKENEAEEASKKEL